MVAERVWDPPPPAREDDVEPLDETPGLLALVLRMLPYAVVAAIPGLLLAPWFGVPFVQDEGVYATVAMGMRHGLVPYADIFDNKTPLVYVVYLLSVVIGGGVYTPRVLAAIALGITAVFVAAIGREFGWRRWQAIGCGAIFALSASNIKIQSNATTEVFMILPLTAALYALLRGERVHSARWYVAAGALAGVAVLFKTAAAPACVPLVLYALTARERGRFTPPALFVIGAVLPIAACVGVFAALGALPEFVYANSTFNRLYFGSTPFVQPIGDVFSMPREIFAGGIWFWLLAGGGAVAGVFRRERSDWLLILFAMGCFAGVKMAGRDYPHYYVELLPAAALLGGRALAALPAAPALRLSAAVLLLPFAVFGAAVYAASVTPASGRAAFVGVRECEAAAPALGAYARANTPPGARIYNLGRDAEIYFYAERLPATRFFYDRAFVPDPSTVPETAAQLSSARPALILDTQDDCPLPIPVPAAISAVIASDYSLVATIGHARIYAPKPLG